MYHTYVRTPVDPPAWVSARSQLGFAGLGVLEAESQRGGAGRHIAGSGKVRWGGAVGWDGLAVVDEMVLLLVLLVLSVVVVCRTHYHLCIVGPGNWEI